MVFYGEGVCDNLLHFREDKGMIHQGLCYFGSQALMAICRGNFVTNFHPTFGRWLTLVTTGANQGIGFGMHNKIRQPACLRRIFLQCL